MADPDARIEDRLAEWFAVETRRAEHDLRAGLRPSRSRRGASHPRAVALAVVAVAVVALGATSLRLLTPSPEIASSAPASAVAGPSSTARATPRATTVSSVRLGSDGLPTAIDGESVGRLEELRAALASQDTAVVAGWVDQPLFRCAEPEWPLLPTCTGRRLSAAEPTGRSGGFSVDLVVGELRVPFGPVAVRVHANDPRAESCPPGVRARCTAAIVVDEVLWRDDGTPAIAGVSPDGIPTEVDGEPVLRPAALEAAAAEGNGPWLLGGWHSADRWRGCGRLGESHPLLDDCSPEQMRGAPGEGGLTLLDARELPDGPLVVRVHTGDPRSESCPPDSIETCRDAVVVEEVVWSREDGATPAPLDEIAVAQAIADAVDPERRSMALAPAPPGKDDCDPGWPPVLWRGTDRASTVGLVAVYASTEEADEVDGRLGAGGWQGLGCTVTFDALVTWRWIRVENAIVQFNLTLPDGTATEVELVDRVRAALQAAVAAP